MKILHEIWNENRYSIISGLAMGLVFAPFRYTDWLVFLIIAPFLLDVINAKSYSSALLKGYWFGFFSVISALYWIAFNTVAGFVFLLFAHPWSYMLFSFFFYILWKNFRERSFFAAAVLWTVLEQARSWGELRFPWLNLYHALSYFENEIQIIEFSGPLLLTFFIISANILIAFAWRKFKKTGEIPVFYFRMAGVFFLLWLISGFWGKTRVKELRGGEYPLLKAGIVQPDIDAYEKSRSYARQLAMQRLLSLSDSLVKNEQIQLVVWPETAVFGYVRSNRGLRKVVQSFSNGEKIPIFTGTLDYRRKGRGYLSFNAGWLVHPDSAVMDMYYKQYLVPGGETIPFKRYFPILEKIDVGGGNFWYGSADKTLNFRAGLKTGRFIKGKWLAKDDDQHKNMTVRLIPAICYESIYPELIREQKVKNDGNIIAIITNDGWYGNTGGPYQHYRAAVFRAIENRTSVVRSANNGISVFIDITGRVFEETKLFTLDARSSYVPVSDEFTVYDKYGLIWLWIFSGIALLLAAWQMVFDKTNSLRG